eukprot:Amastigsp_a177045_147.p2 type:complete len:110 gc:universal Amastigsp_a177045_147:188-517(+)
MGDTPVTIAASTAAICIGRFSRMLRCAEFQVSIRRKSLFEIFLLSTMDGSAASVARGVMLLNPATAVTRRTRLTTQMTISSHTAGIDAIPSALPESPRTSKAPNDSRNA